MDHVTERMVKVYEARDSIEGHFLKDLLTGHGIEEFRGSLLEAPRPMHEILNDEIPF